MPTHFATAFTSAPDAFPGTAPRPVISNLILRSFNFAQPVQATHVRLEVVTNQCTGAPEYQGEQDNDPLNNTDCSDFSPQANNVRAAELQVFSTQAQVTEPPRDPLVVLTMLAPATASVGGEIAYDINYTNVGPADAQQSKITDRLPLGVTFVSATGGGTYDPVTRNVTWNIGTVKSGHSGNVRLIVKVASTTKVGTSIVNQAQYTGYAVKSPPTAIALTVVK